MLEIFSPETPQKFDKLSNICYTIVDWRRGL